MHTTTTQLKRTVAGKTTSQSLHCGRVVLWGDDNSNVNTPMMSHLGCLLCFASSSSKLAQHQLSGGRTAAQVLEIWMCGSVSQQEELLRCLQDHSWDRIHRVLKKTTQDVIVLCQWNRGGSVVGQGVSKWATQPESDSKILKDLIIGRPAQFHTLQDIIKNSENEGARHSHGEIWPKAWRQRDRPTGLLHLPDTWRSPQELQGQRCCSCRSSCSWF